MLVKANTDALYLSPIYNPVFTTADIEAMSDLSTDTQKPTDSLAEKYAAIDLGSNSFHMIVCRYINDELIIEDRLRETVRLGAGIDKKQRLTPEAQERALDCLTRFGQRLHGIPSENIGIVGTNTLRSVKKAKVFMNAAENALAHPIEIISGVEEARLIYLGVAQGIGIEDKKRRLVIDIGGGSTELIIGEEYSPKYMQSLSMGCVSMSQRFFGDSAINRKALKHAEISARVELAPHENVYRKLGWKSVIGASGSIRAIRDVVRENGWSDEGITLESLNRLRDAMLECSDIHQLKLKGLSPERAAVFPGGVVVLLATFKALGIKNMLVSDSALREGLIYDLLGRTQQKDVRDSAIASLSRRYHVDETQAQQVAKTACACARQVAKTWKLKIRESCRWLEWAAQLHEIGLDIAHSQYHTHGAYIAEFADIAGFSRQEQLVLATLIDNHRRKFRKANFKRLAEYRVRNTRYWTILLRLAVLLHRSRSTEPLPEFTLTADKNGMQLRFPKDWLKTHQLTRADLEQERAYLAATDFNLEYC
jgi:exopolyphosphatase/guanosine-5'-triphosphate,3'-diphosphate pyrophosphatase